TSRGKQEPPIKVFVAFNLLARAGVALDAGDDLRGDIAIRLTVEFKVGAAAGPRDLLQRSAIENGANRLGLLGDDCGVGNDAATCRPHANDVHWRIALTRSDQSRGNVSAPGLTIRYDDEGSRILRFAVQFLILLDQLQSPVQPFLDIRIPRRVLFQPKRRMVAKMIQEKEQGI